MIWTADQCQHWRVWNKPRFAFPETYTRKIKTRTISTNELKSCFWNQNTTRPRNPDTGTKKARSIGGSTAVDEPGLYGADRIDFCDTNVSADPFESGTATTPNLTCHIVSTSSLTSSLNHWLSLVDDGKASASPLGVPNGGERERGGLHAVNCVTHRYKCTYDWFMRRNFCTRCPRKRLHTVLYGIDFKTNQHTFSQFMPNIFRHTRRQPIL